MKRAILIVTIIGVVVAGAGVYYASRTGGELHFDTAPITRGDIADAVGAAGTLQAVTTVQVGSQVSGNISWLGADFNSIVRKGQVIARIDPAIIEAQVEQAQASLNRAQADLERTRVAHADAETKYARQRELAAARLIPQSDLDTARVAVEAAAAQISSAQASVVQARASLSQTRLNLSHCVITAPIDGIVIQRSVDIGQTVAASLQSPTLFVIAADLTKMQVNANIDEADVGRIRPRQPVTFRVDAYPSEEFRGTVSQVRLQPVVVQNVTTYGAIIDVPNPELKLKPGMTANLRVQIARRADVLRVPNSALRFRPTEEMFTALHQPVPPEAQVRPGSRAAPAAAPRPSAPPALPAPRAGGSVPGSRPAVPSVPGRPVVKLAPVSARPADTIDQLFAPIAPVEAIGRVWISSGGQLKAVRIRRGITDGTFSELVGNDLQEGAEVVTGVTMPGASRPQAGAGNPFTGRGQPARAPGGGR